LTEIWRKKSADCSFSKPTDAEYAWIGNLGRRFQITRLSRRGLRPISTLEKPSTSLFQALKRKTRLDQIQLARPLKKRGGEEFFFRDWGRAFGGFVSPSFSAF